jgi:hypothetical protein
MKYVLASLTLTFAIAAAFVLTAREDTPEGAITIRRLSCEPSARAGFHIVQIYVQNTTSRSLRDTEVNFHLSGAEETAHSVVQIASWPRGEIAEARTEIELPNELDTCAARFSTRSGAEIPAVYRP